MGLFKFLEYTRNTMSELYKSLKKVSSDTFLDKKTSIENQEDGTREDLQA